MLLAQGGTDMLAPVLETAICPAKHTQGPGRMTQETGDALHHVGKTSAGQQSSLQIGNQSAAAC